MTVIDMSICSYLDHTVSLHCTRFGVGCPAVGEMLGRMTDKEPK